MLCHLPSEQPGPSHLTSWNQVVHLCHEYRHGNPSGESDISDGAKKVSHVFIMDFRWEPRARIWRSSAFGQKRKWTGEKERGGQGGAIVWKRAPYKFYILGCPIQFCSFSSVCCLLTLHQILGWGWGSWHWSRQPESWPLWMGPTSNVGKRPLSKTW